MGYHTDFEGSVAIVPPLKLTLPLPATITTAEGFDVQITAGTFQAGDRFSIMPTRRAANDINVALQKPEELAFAQPIRTSTTATNRGGQA